MECNCKGRKKKESAKEQGIKLRLYAVLSRGGGSKSKLKAAHQGTIARLVKLSYLAKLR